MEKINDAANNTVKVRLNVEVNFIGYSSFQKSTLNLHIKRVPKKVTIITMEVSM